MDLAESNPTIVNSTILKVKEEVETSVFDDGNSQKSFLIRLDNRHWRVSEVIYNIFGSIDGKRTIAEINTTLHDKFSFQIDEHKLINIIQTAFVQNGLLEGCTAITTPPGKTMMWGRFTLLRPSFIEKFRGFTFLFQKLCLVTLSLISIVWLIYVYSFNSQSKVVESIFRLDLTDIVLCYLFVFVSGMVHELGHSIAAMKYGVSPGRIGVGVYFIMPVLFSDVTKIWKINRRQRVIVDLGGMYLQCVFLLISLLLNNLILNSGLINIAILLSGLTILGNLNPFIKFDGYWILVDYLGITEVKSVMADLWKNLIYKMLRKPERPVPLSRMKKNVIYIYSLFTACFFVYFVVFLGKSVLLAFGNVASDVIQLWNLDPSDVHITFKGVFDYISTRVTTFISLFFFAVIIWRMVIKKLVIRLNKTTRNLREEAHCATN